MQELPQVQEKVTTKEHDDAAKELMKSYKTALMIQYEAEQAKKQQGFFTQLTNPETKFAPNSKMKSLPEGFEFIIEQQEPLPALKVEKFNIHELHKRKELDTAQFKQLPEEEAEMAGPSMALFVQEPKED